MDYETIGAVMAGAVILALKALIAAGVMWLLSRALCLGFNLPWAVAASAALVTVAALGGD